MLFEINKLNLIGIPVNIDLLLFGNETLSCNINCSIFLAVQKYIKNTCRINKIRHQSIINLLYVTNMTNLQIFMMMV
jgi:hypothetical protein